MKTVVLVVIVVLVCSALSVPLYDHTEYRSMTQVAGSFVSPSVTADPGTGMVYIATLNNVNGNKPELFICPPSGDNCAAHDISVGQGPGSGTAPSIALDSAGARVVVATLNTAQGSRPWVFICAVNGTAVAGCSQHDVSASQGSSSGANPALAIDPLKGKIYVVTTNNAQSNRPWLYICADDGTACSDHDISAGEGSQSGMNPAIAVDSAGSALFVVADNHDRGSRPWLFRCNDNGAACSSHDLSAGKGDGSGAVPTLALDLARGKLIVVARHLGELITPWMYTCSTDGTGCASQPLLGPADSGGGSFPSLALDLVNNRALVVAVNESQSHAPLLLDCSLNGTDCARHSIGLGRPFGTNNRPSSVAVPALSKLFTVMPGPGDSPGLFISSPAVPLSCPPVSTPFGSTATRFDFPNWLFAFEFCASGYGLIGATSGLCAPGAPAWTVSPPTCVFNATSLTFSAPAFRVAAGNDFAFRITDSAGLIGSDSGGSEPTASVGGPVAFTYLNGVFDAVFPVPTAAGVYAVAFGLDGQQVSVASVDVVPDVFDGAVVSAGFDNTTGVLTAPIGVATIVRVIVEDAYGNGRAASIGDVLSSVVVQVDANGAVSEPSATAVPRGDGTYNAEFVVSPSQVVPTLLRVLVDGAEAPGSPFQMHVPCRDGFVVSDTACVAVGCNPGSVNVAAPGADAAVCVCDDGFTLTGTDNQSIPLCGPCPDGAVCARGLDRPLAAPGFFEDKAGVFIVCKRPSACAGGTAVCASGYTGYMCNSCAHDYYSNSAGDCAACSPAAGGILAVTLIVLVAAAAAAAVLVGLGLARARATLQSRSSDDGVVARTRTLPASLSMILVVLQVVGILGSAQFGWSNSAQKTLNVANVANIDVNLFANECALSSFHTKYVVSVGALFFVLVLIAVVLLVLKAANVFGLGSARVRELIDTVVFSVAPLLYIPMAKATFVLFDCARLPNGHWVLDIDPGVACFDGPWWSVAWLGIMAVLGFVVGVPGYSLWCIIKRRHKLMTPATYARFGALYKLYRVPFYWAGVAELAKRLAIVVAAVFVSNHVLAQIGLLLLVFLVALVAMKSAAPYYYPLYNELDFRLTLVLIILLVLGMASYAERNTGGGSDTVILVGVVLVLLGLAAIAVHAVATDVRQIVRSRKAMYSAAQDRGNRLAALVEREIADLAPHLAGRASVFVADLKASGKDRSLQRATVEMIDL